MSRVRAKRALLATVIVALLMFACLLWLPAYVRHRLNASLAHMPNGYRGHTEEVSFHVWPAGLSLEGFRIEKRDGSVKVPYMRMDALEAKVVKGHGRWPELELRFVNPQVNMVDAPSKAKQQWGPHIDLAELKRKLRLQLRRVVIENGEIHLRNFLSDPQVDVYATHVNVLFDEVTDCLPPSTTCNATLAVRGAAMAQSALRAKGTLKHGETGPQGKDESWRFDLTGEVKDLKLPRVNSALREYAKLDVEKGSATVGFSLHRHDLHLYGTLQPVLNDVDVVGERNEDTKLRNELAAGIAAHYLEKRNGNVLFHYEKRGTGRLHAEVEVVRGNLREDRKERRDERQEQRKERRQERQANHDR
jgi:hypothetical protein